MEDFSFPTVQTEEDSDLNLPFPHFAASPLWFMSPSEKGGNFRRSLSSAEEAVKATETLSDDEASRDRFVSNEEKMDMLWEDFNEDLYQASYDWKKKDTKALDGSKGSSSLLPHRNPSSLVLLLKVLKKLFLIHKNSAAKRASIYKI